MRWTTTHFKRPSLWLILVGGKTDDDGSSGSDEAASFLAGGSRRHGDIELETISKSTQHDDGSHKKPMHDGVVIRHLSKSFGSVEAVVDLSLDMYPGQVFGLLGHNGMYSCCLSIKAAYYCNSYAIHI